MRSTLAANTIRHLLSLRTKDGVWEGSLASSALSTATAVIALAANGSADKALVRRGRDWLAQHQNADGGWGDTVLSVSNISTTALCWAALTDGPSATRAEAWLAKAAASTTPGALAKAIADRYGKDRTFSVPILTALTIGGRLGPDGWRHVPQLPFELAACPHQWFQWLRLPVVSYALPALIAIGLAKHRARPHPVGSVLRNALTPRVMRILGEIQPSCGGFLEATPLTSFVAMSLISAGMQTHEVVIKCLDFLRASIRDDGSWPIDTNLSTWLTTLAINAVPPEVFTTTEREHLTDWLLAQQFTAEHPYTHAAPGAWSWTNLPGAVPDADDTAGALIALARLGVRNAPVLDAAHQGVEWLLDLQNRDGGMPTFCRGWGHLPFDRSGADLTAHALRACAAWLPDLREPHAARVRKAMPKAVAYLARIQNSDGSWTPLWFGHQHAPAEQNRTLGTARVVTAMRETGMGDAAAGVRWLLKAQNTDGGWGGAAGVESSVEETSLALAALAQDGPEQALQAGVDWLASRTSNGTMFPFTPIGFYFASLWYFEELYPVLFAASAAQALQNSRKLGVAALE
jgi:squalene-hopene/tetraprenyl-beta-curcumene cyclase